MASSLLNAGSGVQWPNRIASGKLDDPTLKRWFDPTAFVSPGSFVYGNAGRNALYGPGTRQIDLSLFKTFMFSADQKRRLQFRAELFNVLNRVNFSNPNGALNAGANFGRITSAGSPRIAQFGLKYLF